MLERIIKQRRHPFRKTIYHLQDRHNPVNDKPTEVQEHIGKCIVELFSKETIQAVFCENIRESTEPLSIEWLAQNVPGRYFGFLTGTNIPLYGAENPELSKKHMTTVKEMAQILADKISELRAVRPNDSATEILCDLDESYISHKLITLYLDFGKMIEERSRYIINHAVDVSMRNGYEQIAVVCGRLHTQSLKMQARSKNYSFIVIKSPRISFKDHEEVIQTMEKYLVME